MFLNSFYILLHLPHLNIMKILLAIGSGSFIGGTCRYLISLFFQQRIQGVFPWATFSVNILGCFLIGIVFSAFEKGDMSNDWKLFLATGILGGFTTFSAFSMESLQLMRSGNAMLAMSYVLTSVVIGIVFSFLGYTLMKSF